jgi:hypothetical protein
MLAICVSTGIVAARDPPESTYNWRERRLLRAEWEGAEEIAHQPGQVGPVKAAVPLTASHGVWVEKKILRSLGLSSCVTHVVTMRIYIW